MFQLLLVIIYIAFISLGLPDSLLGSAWPSMYMEFGVPISYIGVISMIIAIGTVVSSLQSDKLTRKFGTGKITTISITMTAVALFGFSSSHSFGLLCFWAVPYGLGAGSVDASLNNYVALHYASRHMSWLHCMWGIGATIGPYMMGYALKHGQNWNAGYQYISFLQIAFAVVLFFSLPLWKNQKGTAEENDILAGKALPLKEVIQISGAKEVMLCFFCYCALEQTTGLWASSYLTLIKGFSIETAAGFASMFFIGITIGRVLSGFISMKLSDLQMIRLGQGIIAAGIIMMLLPLNEVISLVGLFFFGFGCAPIYPCIIHSTPSRFGADKSQAIIGVQMASAYVGTCVMPPLFGLIAKHINIVLLPVYLLIILLLMVMMHELLVKKLLEGMKKMFADYHVHTEFSDDSVYEMEEVVKDAIQIKMEEICFTDHVDYGVKLDWNDKKEIQYRDGMPMANVYYPEYFETIKELQYLYGDLIAIKKGMEFGVQVHTISQYEKLFVKYPFDFIILSVHQIDNLELWTQDFQKGKSQKEYNEKYYQELLEIVKQYKNYSVLGHLDIIIRYDKNGTYPFEKISDIVNEILKIVIRDGKGIEVNTSSYRYGLTDMTPSKDILTLYKKLGGEIITIGSDSHKKGQLGAHIENTKKVLFDMGFRYHCTYENMRPHFHKLI